VYAPVPTSNNGSIDSDGDNDERVLLPATTNGASSSSNRAHRHHRAADIWRPADVTDDEDWDFFKAQRPLTRPSQFQEESASPPTVDLSRNRHAQAARKTHEKRKLLLAIGLCTLFFTIELVGGTLAHSLAVLNDAFHLLSDLLSFVISLSAIYISTWAPTDRMSNHL
jgi:hypothetical protein